MRPTIYLGLSIFRRRQRLLRQRQRMAGDHQLLVRRDDPGRGALAGRLMRGPPALAFASASSSMPSQAASRHTAPRIGTACSPMPAVNTSASSPPSAAASEPSSRPMRYTKISTASSRADPGWRAARACRSMMPETPEQPDAGRAALDAPRVHPVLAHQVKKHAGIEAAGPGSHRQAVEGGEAHRGGHALARRFMRAHAGAIAEVQHDRRARRPRERHAAAGPTRCIRRTGRETRSGARPSRDARRQREGLRDRRLAAVERGVEAGHLRQLRARARAIARIAARLCG